jgi:triosephosphate isomerase
MSRKKIIAANWKMNLDINEAAQWLGDVWAQTENISCSVLVFPSFVLLPDLMDMYEGDAIVFGAQNCSHVESGAYTGEVSAAQLDSVGVEYVIVGHSERRQFFSETNQIVEQKIKQALKYQITPIFCCGEPLEVRQKNLQQQFVKQQLEESLFNLPAAAVAEIVIAYEPIWAIGTGLNATPEEAQEMHAFIRSEIAQKFSDKVAQQMSIIYGGSCKPENAQQLFACADVDGGLIGGASLKADDFLKIVNSI